MTKITKELLEMAIIQKIGWSLHALLGEYDNFSEDNKLRINRLILGFVIANQSKSREELDKLVYIDNDNDNDNNNNKNEKSPQKTFELIDRIINFINAELGK